MRCRDVPHMLLSLLLLFVYFFALPTSSIIYLVAFYTCWHCIGVLQRVVSQWQVYWAMIFVSCLVVEMVLEISHPVHQHSRLYCLLAQRRLEGESQFKIHAYVHTLCTYIRIFTYCHWCIVCMYFLHAKSCPVYVLYNVSCSTQRKRGHHMNL